MNPQIEFGYRFSGIQLIDPTFHGCSLISAYPLPLAHKYVRLISLRVPQCLM